MLRLIVIVSSLSLVVLVAEHFITGYFLRCFYFWKLYHITLFREGEAVKFEEVFNFFGIDSLINYCKQ